MNLDLGSLAFGSYLKSGTGTPSWGTALGQSKPEYKITYPGAEAIIIGMVYCSVPLETVSLPLGKGGRIYQASELNECQVASLFRKVYINGKNINYPFVIVLVKENSDSHSGRKSIKYSDKNAYKSGNDHYSNQEFLRQARLALGLSEKACWFVYSFEVNNQDELHMYAVIVDKEQSITYENSSERKNDWLDLIPEKGKRDFADKSDKWKIDADIINNFYRPYITAIRTKPFLLLAGISGTGKSRIVRELAFKSCPKYLQDKDGTTPGNYCMIEVKPNWHDSTELLGYYSRLGKAGYQFKKFVKFLVKAKMFPKVPFFVCMDEMNLAPVEHYFAEILSIIETKKHPKTQGPDGINKEVIKTDPIIEARYFRELEQLSNTKNIQTGQAYATSLTDRDIYMKLFGITTESDIDPEIGQRTDLTTEGLTLPDNVIIIGTVNMDDTTHQFSRKVIDRAMTIEMNGGKLSEMYGGSRNLEYLSEEEQQKWQKEFRQRYVTADEVLETYKDEAEDIIKKVPARLEEINKALKGTPFEVSYRVLNELTIMIGVMLDEQSGEDIDNIINKAVDRILLMKILPRIEGDSDMFNLKNAVTVGAKTCHNRLEWLKELAPAIVDENDEKYQQTARGKIQEMIDRLENQEFTRFWP